MSLFKISVVILGYFISRVVFAAPCETLTGFQSSQKVCWNDSVKGWVSDSCESRCDALTFFKSSQTAPRLPASDRGHNPAAMTCHALKYPVVILKDAKGNEQTFCTFPDKSIVSADAIKGHVK